jgi:hypothetical protein
MAAVTADNTFYRPVGGDGRHIGVCGDVAAYLAGTGSLALVLEGKGVIASTRSAIFFAAAGLNGAGAVTVTGAKVGDLVLAVINLTTPGQAASSFESTVSVAGQVQQSSTSNLSGNNYLFIVQPQS